VFLAVISVISSCLSAIQKCPCACGLASLYAKLVLRGSQNQTTSLISVLGSLLVCFLNRWDLIKENTVGEEAFNKAAGSSDWETDDGGSDSDDDAS